ncbi:hypothetical protein ACLKA7_010695 [Drosophila subpalustris]
MYCKLRRLDLLRSGQFSDCELHVAYLDNCQKRCSRQFRVHRQMLSSASEEFQRLINHPDFEKNKRVILVDDASPDAYEALLLYIYTYEIYSAITVEMCAEWILLATKYNMPDFVDSYIEKLADQHWPMGTVLKIFQLANDHNRPSIMKLVGEKIVPIATQVLDDNSFLRLSVGQLKALMIILKSLGTIPEWQLLLALKKYQKCNNLHYCNMACFQQFVEVTNLFGELLFEVDGTLAVDEKAGEVRRKSEVAAGGTALDPTHVPPSTPPPTPQTSAASERSLLVNDMETSEPEEESGAVGK